MNKFSIQVMMVAAVLLLSSCSTRKEEKIITEPSISVHGVGFKDPASSNFHAKYIQSKNYDLQLCKSCHGADFSGGTTGQSCNTCHNKPNGPENCTTCHGSVNAAPPKDLSGNVSTASRGVGAHQKHLIAGTFAAAVTCNECHKVPAKLSDAGHIDASANAEVKFDTTSVFYKANASYTSSNVSCANTYCHGNFNGGNTQTMVWTNNTGTAAQCGTCHGNVNGATLKEKAFPVSGHNAATVASNCGTCHAAVVDASLNFVDASRHINGQIN
ncbi:MAG: CxxxxCH/CxxCH domain c-type cytochrome [Bacteroidota bacterium]